MRSTTLKPGGASALAGAAAYAASTADGGRLDITVFDRDQQAADAFYRLYRRVRVKRFCEIAKVSCWDGL